jgi:hypothetical protein
MNATEIKLTAKQAYVFRGVVRHGYTGYTAVAKALVRKGLLHSAMHSYDRYEWGRKVASLPKYTLTAAGVEMSEVQADALKVLAGSYITGKHG